MPLTPADIHNVAFKKPPIGKRGYDEEEVDAFLDEVEQELIRLLEENNALRNQAQRGGGGGMASNPAATMVITNEFADLQAQLERLQEARARAEQNARDMQAQLERARSATPSGAMPTVGDDDRNARVLMMAQRTADEHMRDAQREVEALLDAARGKAEQLTAEAQMKASTIESDARRNHAEAMDSLVEKRAALIDEIDKLGQLAKGYQQALTNHVTQQLMDLTSGPDAAGRELE
ncbi:DivIVA domain-containing protein [Actinoplanes octamycinicus]|uniref:Cell wall synthesis protein Wag31 n=1 Tax=Actinoplanes octamycinicus TaxID=135948 RepID=A0A7W7M7V2_9ACTN|nr:DivIVA domain-containing protein [Actinoplanes octamycinicus]MBB4740224.1 DivIVA domain-containing protein [Actinoplanes octamycinicus]GIE59620.1 cell wall synthesis protein Wag31 [Actinoplanes octamycinicus]